MATDLKYTNVPGKLKAILDKIREVGVPPRVTQTWLVGLGFASTNDRTLIGVLRQINFIDEGGRPTDLWQEFRGRGSPALARGIHEGYQSLYATYSDAHSRSNSELESLVKVQAPKLSQETVSRVVSTFKTLVSLTGTEALDENAAGILEADWRDTNGRTPIAVPALARSVTDRANQARVTALPPITVNIEVKLPDKLEGDDYFAIFRAIREGLWPEFSSNQKE